MTVQRIRITLKDAEYSALADLAIAELRPLESQARFLLRAELERRGLLQDDDAPGPDAGQEVPPCQM